MKQYHIVRGDSHGTLPRTKMFLHLANELDDVDRLGYAKYLQTILHGSNPNANEAETNITTSATNPSKPRECGLHVVVFSMVGTR